MFSININVGLHTLEKVKNLARSAVVIRYTIFGATKILAIIEYTNERIIGEAIKIETLSNQREIVSNCVLHRNLVRK